VNSVLAYLGRFAVIILGYAAASLAASAFLHLIFLGALGWSAEEAPFVMMGSIFFSIPLIALFVAYLAFIPSIGAILLAEFIGARDWLFYALAGAAVSIVVIGFFWQAAEPGNAIVAHPARRHGLLGDLRAHGRQLASSCPSGRYFAWAVSIFRAKAENTPANR
jgi:hypothetical protein